MDDHATVIPTAAVARKRSFSVIWLLPVVALVAGVWLVFTTFAERGPSIDIVFDTASGIEPGKTPIRFRDVQIGLVESVTLSDDFSHVVVSARMDRGAADKLREGTQFWIESARITAGGVSGLGTLLSGAYIGMRPGTGDSQRTFSALDTPPVYQVDIPGKTFVLRAEALGSVSPGAPLFFRGIEVGSVLGHQLAGDDEGVTVYAFVRKPYDAFVRRETQFWNASGIDVSVTAAGVRVHTESLQSILIGGIAFDTPLAASGGEPAADNSEFKLFASYDATQQAKFTVRVPFLMYFTGSVAGLEPGAPVLSSGIRLGEVTDVRLEVDPQTLSTRIPVTIALEPQRWTTRGEPAPTPEEAQRRIARFVDRGLRGQLQSGNLLTGAKVVALEIFPDAQPASLSRDGEVSVIPTVPSQVEMLTQRANAFLDKLDQAPIAELVADLRETVQEAERLLASPAVKQGVESLREVGPLLESLRNTSEAARATIAQAETTLASADDTIGADSALRFDLDRLLKELTSTARSLRTLADFLERNPNALILGRPLPE